MQGRGHDLGSRVSKPLPWEDTAKEGQKERRVLAPSPSWHLSRLFLGLRPISGRGSREGFTQGSDPRRTGAFHGWDFTVHNDAKPVEVGRGVEGGVRGGEEVRKDFNTSRTRLLILLESHNVHEF